MTEKKLEGMRFSSGKMNFWSQIPKDALVELMRVYHVGGIKYDEGNWLKGMPFSSMANPLERHWIKWSLGLTTDSKETKCHHLAMVAWNAIGLLTYELRGIGVDDRVKLPIDEDFNWIGGPAASMDLGLSNEELAQLATKYAKNKEEFKKNVNTGFVEGSDSGKTPLEKVADEYRPGKNPPPDVQALAQMADALERRQKQELKNILFDAFLEAMNKECGCPIMSINHINETLRIFTKFLTSNNPGGAVEVDAFLETYTSIALEYCQTNYIPVDLEKFFVILSQYKENWRPPLNQECLERISRQP